MDLFIPENVSQEIIKDLFGVQQGTDYIKGAVDSLNAMEFDTCLHGLKTISGINLNVQSTLIDTPLFYEWFIKNESDVMKPSMIACVRESVGLRFIPFAIYY